MPTYTTQQEIRDAFWEAHPGLVCRMTPYNTIESQNRQPADTRAAFVDFVDQLARNNDITEELAGDVTL